ncbi:MAG: tRNA 2-thiouridine(34) synthase MnmA, partial [Candidatus Omnitrophota bacterium]
MKASKNKRVVVAMSGVVDSSFAACLLKKKGYEVIGISMKLWPKEDCGFHQPTSCCSLEAIADARLVAEKLDIPFYVIDLHKEFKTGVIDYFIDEYLRGRTPNPCILCNEKIKFGALMRKAEELDSRYVATGHYAAVGYDRARNSYILKEGRDKRKDQTYVLFSLTQEQLLKTLFPLSNLKKKEVRRLASRFGIPTYNKAESQDICFVQDNYVAYLSNMRKESIKPGPIVNEAGEVLGTHRGIPFYTIGQREGLGIAYKYALYVLKIDAEKNTLIVGPKENRYSKEISVNSLSWVVGQKKKELQARVKIRSQHKK